MESAPTVKFYLLHSKIQAGAHRGVGTHFAIGYSHMGRVNGIAFQGRLIGKGRVQHQVRIGRAGQRIGVNVHFQQPRDLPGQPFQPGLMPALTAVFSVSGMSFSFHKIT